MIKCDTQEQNYNDNAIGYIYSSDFIWGNFTSGKSDVDGKPWH